jgi:hypothetical protein
MRVSFRRDEEQVGLFRVRTSYKVYLTVQMTEEEIATSKHMNVADHIVFTDDMSTAPFEFRVKDFFKEREHGFTFHTLNDALQFEHVVKGSLANFKNAISVESVKGTSEVFEL